MNTYTTTYVYNTALNYYRNLTMHTVASYLLHMLSIKWCASIALHLVQEIGVLAQVLPQNHAHHIFVVLVRL